MWKSQEFFNIHTTIESLSQKFQELESGYYGFLKKSHNENQRILQQESNLNSQFFHNLLKEQSLLETNIKQLASTSQSFHEEIAQLKNLLSQEQTNLSGPGDPGGPFQASQHYLNTKFTSLKTKVLSIPDLVHNTYTRDALETNALDRIDRYFQEAMEDVNSTYAQFSGFTKENIPQQQTSMDWRRIEEVINTNLPSFTGLEISVNSIKAKLVRSLGEFDTFTVSYNKEANSLRDTLEQIKLHIGNMAKEAKSDSLRPMSPGTRSRGGEDTHLAPQVRRCCTVVGQLLSDIANSEYNRNKHIGGIKEEMKGLREDVKYQLQEVSKHITFLKGNNQKVNSVLGDEITRAKRSRSPHDDTIESPGSKPRSPLWGSRTLLINKSATSISEQKMGLIPSPKTALSPSVGSPLQAILLQNQLKKYSNTFSGPEKFMPDHLRGSPREVNGSYSNEPAGKETKVEYELVFKTLGQKLVYLETSIKNLIVSSGKVASLFVNFTGEEELALRVYESDKRSLESSLNSFKTFIAHSFENIKTSSSQPLLSPSYDARKKGQGVLSPGRISKEDQAILIEDSLEEEQKKGSPGRKLETRKKANQFQDFYNLEKSNKLSVKGSVDSPTIFTTLSDEGRMNPRAVSAEIAELKARYEEVSNERDKLKRENTMLKFKGAGTGSVEPLQQGLGQNVEEIASQKENLTRENLKLLKAVKKLHKKAEERKKNLKQLFELMTEKEKEIEQYKNTLSKLGIADIPKSEASKQGEKERKSDLLDIEIKKKEKELKRLEEAISAKKIEGEGLLRTKEYDVYADKVVEIDKRRQKLEEVLAKLRPEEVNEITEVRETLALLNREKEQVLRSKGIILERGNMPIDAKREEPKSASSKKQQQQEQQEQHILRVKIQEQEEIIQMLENDKKELEEKCQELVSSIESAQEHKKKLEKNYNDEIRILTQKEQELIGYIQGLESKNTQLLRGSLSNEKWKGAVAEEDLRDENKRLKFERDTVIETLQTITESLEVEGYVNWDGYETLRKLWTTLLERREDESQRYGRSSQRENRETGSFRALSERGKESARKGKIELENAIEGLKEELESAAVNNKQILAEVEKLKQDIKRYKAKNNELAEKVSSLEGVIGKLRSSLKGYKLIREEEEDVENQIVQTVEAVLREYDMLKRRKGGEEGRTSLHQKKGSEFEEDGRRGGDDLQRKLRDKMVGEGRGRGEVEDPRKTLIEKDKIIMDLTNELLEEREKAMSFERTSVSSKEKIIKELRDEIHTKNNEIFVLKNTIIAEKEKTIIGLRDELSERNKRINVLENNTVPTKEKAIQDLQERVRELETKAAATAGSGGNSRESAGGEKERTLQQLKELVAQKQAVIAEKDRALNELQQRYRKEMEELNQVSVESQENMRMYVQQNTQLKSEVEKINERLIGVNEHLDQMRQRNSQLAEEKRELEKQLSVVKEESRNLQKQLNERKGSFSGELRTSEIQRLQNEKAELETKANTLSGLLDEAKADIERLGYENNSLNEDLVAARESIESLREQTEHYEKEKVTLEAQINEQKSLLKQRNTLLEQQAANLNMVKKELEQTRKELKETKEELDDLKAMDFNIKGHAEKMEEDLRRSEQKWTEMENTLQKVAREKEELIEKLSNVRQQAEEYEEQLDVLKNSVKEVDRLKEEVKSKDEEIGRLNSKCLELERHSEELLEKKKSLRREMEDIKEGKEKLENEHQQLKKSYTTLNEKVKDTMKASLENAEARYEEIKKDYDRMKIELGKSIQTLEAKKRSVEEENKMMKREIEEKEEKIRRLEGMFVEKEGSHGALEKVIKESEEAIRLKEKEIRELRERYQEKEKVIRDREEEIGQIREAAKKQEEELESLQEQVERLGKLLAEKEKDLESAGREYSELSEAYSSVEKELKENIEEILAKETEIVGLKRKVEALQEDLAAEKRRREEAEAKQQKDLESAGREYSELREAYSSIERELKENMEELKAKEDRLSTVEKESRQEIDGLKGRLEASEQQVQQARGDVNRLEQALRDKEEEILAKETEIAGLKRKVEALQEDLAAEKRRREEAEVKHREEVEQVEKEIMERAGANIEAISEKEKKLNEKNKELKRKVGDLQEEREELQGQIRNLKVNLGDIEAHLQGKIDEANRKNQEIVVRSEQMKAAYENKLQERSQDIRELESDVENLKRTLEERSQEGEVQIRMLKEERERMVGEYEKRIGELESEVKRVEESMKEKEVEIEEARRRSDMSNEDTRKAYEERLEEKNRSVKELEGEVERLKEGARRKEEEILRIRNENVEERERMVKDYEGRLEESQRLQGETQELRSALSRKEMEIVEVRKKNLEEIEHSRGEYEERIEVLSKEIGTLSQENSRLSRRVEDLGREIEGLTQKNREAAARYEEMKRKSDTAIQERNERIQLLENDIALLRRGIQDRDLEVETLRQSGSQEVRQVREGYDNRIKALNEELEGLRKENLTLGNQVTSSRALYEECFGKLSNVQLEHADLIQRLNNTQSELEGMKREVNMGKEMSNKKDTEIEQAKGRVSEVEQNHKKLKEDLEEVRKQKDEVASQLEKVTSEKGTLEAKYQSLKEEKRSLEETSSQLRQDINNLTVSQTQHERKISEDLRQKTAIITSLSESFEDLQKIFPLKGKIDPRFQDKTQVEEAIQILKETIQAKDKDIERLTKEVETLDGLKRAAEVSYRALIQETDNRIQENKLELESKHHTEKEELQHAVRLAKEEMEQRLVKLRSELEAVVQGVSVEIVGITEEPKNGDNVVNAEKAIYSYIAGLRKHLEESEKVRQDYHRLEQESEGYVKQIEELRNKASEAESMRENVERENNELRKEIGKLNDKYKDKEAEIERLNQAATAPDKKKHHEKPSDFDIPSVDITDDLDDQKIKKLMEDTFKVERRGDEKSDLEGGTQNLRQSLAIQEEFKELREENERLDLELRQLRSQYDLLQECNEELKGEVNEKEDEVKKMEYQMAVLKDEFAKLEKEKNQTTIAHEKQHIRMMFIKFMESALAGTKEAPELLKYLLALLDLSEANKTQIIEGFKAKANKKSGFKVF